MFFSYLLCYENIFDILWSLSCFFLCALTGNLDWVGNEFTFNAGAGLVISQPEGIEERNSTVVEQLKAAFERDWFSRYTHSLQANKIPICNKHQINKLVPVKPSHLDNGPVPIRTGQYSNRPAPVRNSHKGNGQTSVKVRHHGNRQSKINHQDMANGLVLSIDTHQEKEQVKISHPDNKQVQIKGNIHGNPMDPPNQSAESSGSREISNGSLWIHDGLLFTECCLENCSLPVSTDLCHLVFVAF